MFEQDLQKLIAAGATEEDVRTFFAEEGVSTTGFLLKLLEGLRESSLKPAEVKAMLADIQIPDDTAHLDELKKTTGETLKAVKGIKLPEIPKTDLTMLEHGLIVLSARIDTLQKDLKQVKKDVADSEAIYTKLLTARRVPVRNAKGELVGVELDAD